MSDVDVVGQFSDFGDRFWRQNLMVNEMNRKCVNLLYCIIYTVLFATPVTRFDSLQYFSMYLECFHFRWLETSVIETEAYGVNSFVFNLLK